MTEIVSLPVGGMTDSQWAVQCLPMRVLAIAEHELANGTAESPIGSNRGPRVDAILRSARSRPGMDWSAAFVTWCCLWSSWKPFSEIPGAGVMYPASVVSWIAWARKCGRYKDGSPARGDLFVVDRPGASHMGVVDLVYGMSLDGIAGDSNGDVPGDGREVARETHAIYSLSGFISLEGIPCR